MNIFKSLVESIAYLHNNNVVHRDLKLENILVDQNNKQTKLIDFGCSVVVKKMQQTRLQYVCGTPLYMSPEMVEKRDYLGGPADIWALGVILFILLTGKKPVHAEFEQDLLHQISTCQYLWPLLFD